VKTQVYWYDQGGWDNNPGRVSLILDAAERRLGVDACTSERILTGRLDGAVAAVFFAVLGTWRGVCSMFTGLMGGKVGMPGGGRRRAAWR
jgi:hypothetical protein